jgi:hypothetical protein
MKVFRFYIGDYDGLNYNQLFIHQDDKTEEEFDADVKFLMKKYFEEYYETLKNKHYSSPHLEYWVKYSLERISELGYEKYEPITSSIYNPCYYDMFEKTPEKDKNNIIPLINKDLYNKIKIKERSKKYMRYKQLRKEYPEAYEEINND